MLAIVRLKVNQTIKVIYAGSRFRFKAGRIGKDPLFYSYHIGIMKYLMVYIYFKSLRVYIYSVHLGMYHVRPLYIPPVYTRVVYTRVYHVTMVRFTLAIYCDDLMVI